MSKTYIIQSNGKTKLGYVPFTGKPTERSEGVKRKKAGLGDIIKFATKAANDIVKNHNYQNNYGDYQKQYDDYNKEEKIKSYVGLGTNILGNISSMLINNSALNKMQAPNTPVMKRAAKLKTSININPQLTEIDRFKDNAVNDINDNTVSSKTAINRLNKINTIALDQYNKVLAQKENTNNQLINQDKLNLQGVAATNVDSYNQHQKEKTAFNNAITEKKAENFVGAISNIGGLVQNEIFRLDQKQKDDNTLKAYLASHPNVNPKILAELGIPIDPNLILKFDKLYG